jgi:ligand-binding sensor domain-containing protein
MTTFDGLVRYDGVRFKVFNSVNTPGIRNTRFVTMYEDSEKNLWVATEENGITLYRDGRFTTYTTEEGLPHNRISRKLKVREDSRGLVINTDGGPVRWENGKLRPCGSGEVDSYATKGFAARAGVIWFVGKTGLQRIENGRLTAVVPSRWSSEDEIRAMFETPSGAVWISTPHPKGELWRLSNGQITLMTGRDGLPGRWITGICEDRNGNTWIGTADAGLYLFKDDRITAFTTAEGLSSDHIASIYEDREGNVWIGTEKGSIGSERKPS